MNLCFVSKKLIHVEQKTKCLRFNIILKLKIIVSKEKLLAVKGAATDMRCFAKSKFFRS